MPRLRIGILGSGNIARQFAEHVENAKRSTITAVASRRQASADEFADRFVEVTAHAGYESLLRDRNVDAVYVALPNSLHCEWTIKALEAGKHVLCEKPLAETCQQAERMFDTARQMDRLLVEAFMYRSHPLLPEIKATIDRGEIGQLRAIRANFCFRVRRPEGNIRFDAELAGGALRDVGVYCINFSRYLAGEEPDRAFAVGDFHSSGVDELTGACLHFPSGVVSVFLCGLNAQNDNTVHVCGSDGYLTIPFAWKPPAKQAEFTIVRQPPPRMDQVRGAVTATPPPQVVRIDSDNSLYGQEADDFAAAVMEGATTAISEQDTMGNLKVVETLLDQLSRERR